MAQFPSWTARYQRDLPWIDSYNRQKRSAEALAEAYRAKGVTAYPSEPPTGVWLYHDDGTRTFTTENPS